jgi:thiol peroxidase
MERTGVVMMQGKPVTLVGPEIKVGDIAPDFTCIDTRLNLVRLSDTKGKIRLIASVPSLDTTVCNKETIKFNDEAEKLADDRVVWLTISMDLPFAQKRYIEDEDIQNMKILSDYKDAAFGEAYGVLMKEHRLLARAVFVVDGKDIVRHVEYVRENTQFPNFDEAVNVVKGLLAGGAKAAA